MWWWINAITIGEGSNKFATKRNRDRWQGNAIINNMISEVSALIADTRYEAKPRKKE